ncbi:MAG: hypothetical protein ABI240_07150 [Sphingomonas sp.]
MPAQHATLSSLGLAALLTISGPASAQSAPDLDKALIASKPLFESNDVSGRVQAAVTTDCTTVLTLEGNKSYTMKFIGHPATADGNAMMVDVANDSVVFSFRGEDADAIAKAAAKALAPVTARCKG